MPSGYAIAILGSRLPRRYKVTDHVLAVCNRVIRISGRESRIDYVANVLHSYIAEFIEREREAVLDYFIDFPDYGGCTLLVRK